MKTRDELNSMTKQEIINYLSFQEVLHKIDEHNGVTFGHVSLVEEVGKAIVDQKTCFNRLIRAETDVDGSLVITLPSADRIKAENLATMQSISREMTAVKAHSDTLKSSNNSAGADVSVIYRPVGFDQKPFIFNGKRFDRDELRAMGVDELAHNAIHEYVNPVKRPEFVKCDFNSDPCHDCAGSDDRPDDCTRTCLR